MTALYGDAPLKQVLDLPMRSIKAIDDTDITPLEHELDLVDGSMSISGFQKYLHEHTQLTANGRYSGDIAGMAAFPTITLNAHLNAFFRATGSTWLDFWNATTGSIYAAAVNTRDNTRLPHRHIILTYRRSETSSHVVALEHCTPEPGEIGDDNGMMFSGTFRVTGRIFLDGKIYAGPIGASLSVPSWAELPS